MRNLKSIIAIITLGLITSTSFSQKAYDAQKDIKKGTKDCSVKVDAFQGGEELKYTISYNWGVVWVDAGTATFKVSDTTVYRKPVYHLKAIGETSPKWNKIFPVYDTYESWVNKDNLKPYKFKRRTNEDGWKISNDYLFNRRKDIAYTFTQSNDKPFKKDTLETTECTYDILSIIYYARCLDYSQYKVNDTIPVTILLDNEVFNVYYRYLGKEVVKSKEFGKRECFKVSAYLVQGTIFEEGEDLFVWVTNDKNKVPLKVQSPIIVGSVIGRCTSVKGLKFPMTPEIKKK